MNLIIFDLDSTLIKPNFYRTKEQVRDGVYDLGLLKPYFADPAKYQVAIASFNSKVHGCLSGPELCRTVLDLMYEKDSRLIVPDEFIEAWMPYSYNDMVSIGKNRHISNIISAFYAKNMGALKIVMFFDDNHNNVFLANKRGYYAYFVKNGLTRNNLKLCRRLGRKVEFTLAENVNLSVVGRLGGIPVDDQNKKRVIFLNNHLCRAREEWEEFLKIVGKDNIEIIQSDLA